jgi:hypothetical protein
MAHGTVLKETYKNMFHIQNTLEHEDHSWKLHDNLKVSTLLLGLQGELTWHYCCFLYLQDTEATEHRIKSRPAREEFVPGERNDKHTVVSGCPIAYKAGLN